MMNFTLDDEQQKRAVEFERQQDAIWAKSCKIPGHEGEAYYGAIGSSMTFLFIPTSLGVITKIKHATGAELDLTDYDSW